MTNLKTNFGKRAWLYAGLLSIALAGCAGSGNNNGGGAVVVPLTSHMRMLQNGDSWTWNFVGNQVAPGGASSAVTATLTQTVSGVTAVAGGNQYTLTGNESRTVGGVNTVSTATGVFVQAADGSVTEVSETTGGVTTTVTANSGFAQPGLFAANTASQGNLTFSDGSTASDKFTVVMQDANMITADGFAWNTWQTNQTSTVVSGANTNTFNTTGHWAPALGTFVSEDINNNTSTGSTLTGTWTLTATTVPSTQFSVGKRKS